MAGHFQISLRECRFDHFEGALHRRINWRGANEQFSARYWIVNDINRYPKAVKRYSRSMHIQFLNNWRYKSNPNLNGTT
jgi:hypothetical protein